MKNEGVLDNELRPLADAAKAAKLADNGLASCRKCGAVHSYPEVLTLNYGNGVVYALCLDCVRSGTMMIVVRTSRGIEVKTTVYPG